MSNESESPVAMSAEGERRLAAAKRAAFAAGEGVAGPAKGGAKVARRLSIGDPQAPLDNFFAVLEHHGALGDDGWLRPEVALVSMGDHFDWGTPDDRPQATREGPALLAWLAAHPPAQVTILLGNHDLGRVCELADLDDESFAKARAEADLAYRMGHPDPTREQLFRGHFPQFFSSEAAARNFGCFSVAQRTLVSGLLRAGRVQLAAAAGERLLLLHAGITAPQLASMDLSGAPAPVVAASLNAFLQQRVRAWSQGPLDLAPYHQPGSAASGEGRGLLYQRPSNPSGEEPARFAGLFARRFDPRTLPLHLTQAVGHIRDKRCRQLLRPWSQDSLPHREGPLRQLFTDGEAVRYTAGASRDAAMIFCDGGMLQARAGDYQLLDLDLIAAAAPG